MRNAAEEPMLTHIGVLDFLSKGSVAWLKPDDTEDIRNGMLLQILDLDLGNFGPDVGDPGISDKDVKMINAMRCKRLHGVSGVGGHGGIELDEYERGALGLWASRKELWMRHG